MGISGVMHVFHYTNYPGVVYWRQSVYIGSGKTANDTGVTSVERPKGIRYFGDEFGAPLDEDLIASIQKYAQSIWQDLGRLSPGIKLV